MAKGNEEKKGKGDDLDLAEGKAAGGGGKQKLILFGAIGVVVLAIATGATLYFLGVFGKGAEEGEVAAEAAAAEHAAPQVAVYHALDPRFIVNFQNAGPHKYLQVEVQVMARDPLVIETVKQHAPMIRNNLLLLFGGQDAEALKAREAKDHLREEVLAEINRVVEQETGKTGIESVFFTSFVMQ